MYCVVYNIPILGIYKTWSEASKIITGLSNVTHKTFINNIEVKQSFANYKTPELLRPCDLVSILEGNCAQALKNQ